MSVLLEGTNSTCFDRREEEECLLLVVPGVVDEPEEASNKYHSTREEQLRFDNTTRAVIIHLFPFLFPLASFSSSSSSSFQFASEPD